MLKARIQPWLEEAFLVTTTMDKKLAQMQNASGLRQESAPDRDASESRAQLIQQTTKECVAAVRKAQKLLDGICAKISVPAE